MRQYNPTVLEVRYSRKGFLFETSKTTRLKVLDSSEMEKLN